MKKRYPEPFKRDRSPFYYFTIHDAGKRHNISTKETTKERARIAVRAYVDEREVETSNLSFAEYARPYFVWEKDKDRPICPHARRILDEGKSIGRTHPCQCRSMLERHILADRYFAALRVTLIRRRDIIELRDRLRERGGAKITTANKVIAAVKIILAEAFLRAIYSPFVGRKQVLYDKINLKDLQNVII